MRAAIVPTGVEKTFRPDQIIVSKTDTQGRLTYVNGLFVDISGYPEHELIGKPHNIIRHPDMPRSVFKLLWDRIASGHAFITRSRPSGVSTRFQLSEPTSPSANPVYSYHCRLK